LEAVSGPMSRRTEMRPVDRVVAAFLLVLLAAGTLWLWVGMPLLTLWAIAKLVDKPAQHLTLGLIGVPAGIILFAPVLLWINGLYLRVTGARRHIEDEEGGELLRVQGPLEPLLVWSLAIAFVTLIVWLITGSGGVAPLGPFI
jgi:hypothetical protein